MTVVEFNTAGRCSHCGGVVQNVEGRRRTVSQLATIHGESCPGVLRRKQKETA